MTEADLPVIRNPGSTTIGTTMDHGVSHPIDIVSLNFKRVTFKYNGADYSAHESDQELKVSEIGFKWGIPGTLDLYCLR